MEEGTEEKGANGEAGAPDDSSTGLEAVVSDDGAAGVGCPCPIDKFVTEITK